MDNKSWVWANGYNSKGILVKSDPNQNIPTLDTFGGQIRIQFSSSTITIRLNYIQFYTGTIPDLTTGAGKLGFRNWGGAQVRYYPLEYYPPGVQP